MTSLFNLKKLLNSNCQSSGLWRVNEHKWLFYRSSQQVQVLTEKETKREGEATLSSNTGLVEVTSGFLWWKTVDQWRHKTWATTRIIWASSSRIRSRIMSPWFSLSGRGCLIQIESEPKCPLCIQAPVLWKRWFKRRAHSKGGRWVPEALNKIILLIRWLQSKFLKWHWALINPLTKSWTVSNLKTFRLRTTWNKMSGNNTTVTLWH